MTDIVNIALKTLRLPDKDPEILFCDKRMLLDQDVVDIPFDIQIGLNEITIQFLNKTNRDTRVIDGKIVNDLAVIVDKIEYRGQDLRSYINHIGTYVDEKGQTIIGTNGFMAFNGTLTIKLVGPIFVYLRDLAIQHG